MLYMGTVRLSRNGTLRKGGGRGFARANVRASSAAASTRACRLCSSACSSASAAASSAGTTSACSAGVSVRRSSNRIAVRSPASARALSTIACRILLASSQLTGTSSGVATMQAFKTASFSSSSDAAAVTGTVMLFAHGVSQTSHCPATMSAKVGRRTRRRVF